MIRKEPKAILPALVTPGDEWATSNLEGLPMLRLAQLQAIYDGAATDLKNSISSDGFVALMQRIDHNMGACGPPAKRFDIHINITQQGTFRDQGYTRKCANGELAETVTIVIRNGEAKLAGYHLANPAAAGGDD